MSHHFDYTADERLDISDAYCFAGPSDAFGPRTVFGMNASPENAGLGPRGLLRAQGRHQRGPDRGHHLAVHLPGRLGRRAARRGGRAPRPGSNRPQRLWPDHHAPNAPVGEVLEVERGIKNFAGPRTDSFFNYLAFPITLAKALNGGFFPDLDALKPAYRLLHGPNRPVRPGRGAGRGHRPAAAELLGHHRGLRPGARLGPAAAGRGAQRHHPVDLPHRFGRAQHQRHRPVAGPRWQARPPRDRYRDRGLGQIRDQAAVVVGLGGTYNQGVHGRPTALAYGAYVADVFLPMVIPFPPGTNALWDPWQGSHNGKGLTEDAFDNAAKVILNQDFVPA